MLKERAKLVAAGLMLGDLLAVSAAFLVAYVIRQTALSRTSLASNPLAPLQNHLPMVLAGLVAWAVSLWVFGSYRSHRTRTLTAEGREILRASSLAIVFFVLFVFATKLDARLLDGERLSRLLVGLWGTVAFFCLVGYRFAVRLSARAVRRRGRNYRNTVVIGTSALGREVAHQIENHKDWGVRVLGFVATTPQDQMIADSMPPILGELGDLSALTEDLVIDEVFVAAPELPLETTRKIVTELGERGVCARIGLTDHPEDPLHPVIDRLGHLPFLTFDPTPVGEIALFGKRCFDLTLASILLVLLSPVAVLTATAIRLSSKGPTVFRQTRVGLRGRRFTLLKFRTMHTGAEERKRELEVHNEMSGPVFKLRNDPRVTRLGRFLRRHSLDELPQLWNVVRGDMSLVGPRPPMPHEVEKYEPWQRRRLSMRPGITCLWQVAGRSEIDFDRWVALDLEYIDNWSPWLDLQILLRTIPAVLSGKGAF